MKDFTEGKYLVVGTGAAALRIADVLTTSFGVTEGNLIFFSRRIDSELLGNNIVINSISSLEAFDAVFIATESFDHLAWVKRCIAESRHCYVEKPLVCSAQFMGEVGLVDQVENANICVFNGCQYLSHPSLNTLKTFLNNSKADEILPIIFRMHLGHDICSWGCWRNETKLDDIGFLRSKDGLFDELIHVYEILACLFGLEGEVFEIGSDNLMLNQNASAGTISYKNRHIFGSILIELVSENPIFEIYLSSREDQVHIDFRDDNLVDRESLFIKHIEAFFELIVSYDPSKILHNNKHVFDGLLLRSRRKSFFL